MPRDSNNKSADNDDGHLMVYVYNNATDATTLNVYDARSMAEKPVASIQVGRRVPYGFHGTWLTQEQIASQAYLA